MKVNYKKNGLILINIINFLQNNANSPNDCLAKNKNFKFVNHNNHINLLSSKGKSKFRLNNILLFISFIK